MVWLEEYFEQQLRLFSRVVSPDAIMSSPARLSADASNASSGGRSYTFTLKIPVLIGYSLVALDVLRLSCRKSSIFCMYLTWLRYSLMLCASPGMISASTFLPRRCNAR